MSGTFFRILCFICQWKHTHVWLDWALKRAIFNAVDSCVDIWHCRGFRNRNYRELLKNSIKLLKLSSKLNNGLTFRIWHFYDTSERVFFGGGSLHWLRVNSGVKARGLRQSQRQSHPLKCQICQRKVAVHVSAIHWHEDPRAPKKQGQNYINAHIKFRGKNLPGQHFFLRREIVWSVWRGACSISVSSISSQLQFSWKEQDTVALLIKEIWSNTVEMRHYEVAL